jgi:hypothetical protein
MFVTKIYVAVMRGEEHQLQVSCVNYYRYKWSDGLIYAIPNGGKRNIGVARSMKAEGVLSGVPDLHVPIARCGYHSLYIELKNGSKGRVSESQEAMMRRLAQEGHLCVVVRDIDGFMNLVDSYMEGSL